MKDCNGENCSEIVMDNLEKIEKLLAENGLDSSDVHVGRALVTLFAQGAAFSGATKILAEGIALSDITLTFRACEQYRGGKVGRA